MAIAIACPHCKKVNELEESRSGLEVRCAHCGKGFLLKLKTTAQTAPPPPREEAIQSRPRPQAPPADDLPPPRRRGRDDDKDDDGPPLRRRSGHDRGRPSERGRSSHFGLILGLSIGGVALVVAVVVILVLTSRSSDPGQPAKVNIEDEFTQKFNMLQANDEAIRNHGIEWFMMAPINEKRRPEVAAVLDRYLTEDARRNRKLMVCVQRWGTVDNIPKLAIMLDAERLGAEDVIRALAGLKDARSADVLARRIGNFFDGKEARQALVGFGHEMAEKAVIPQLTNQEGKQRIAAAELLAIVGTKQSLAPLNNAARVFPKDRRFTEAVGIAVQAIQGRG